VALTGSSRSSWRVNTVKNQATQRKVRPRTDITSTAIRKEEMVVCLFETNSFKEGAI
jgi:hypothetical protein